MTEVEVPILQPMAARNRALRPCNIAVGSAARARSTRPQDERTFRNTYVARRAPGPDGDSIGVWCRALERDGVVPSSAARLRHDGPRPGKVRYCLASRRRRGGQSPNTSDDHQDTEHPPTGRIGAERPGHKTCNPPRDHSPHPSRRPATGWPQRPAESAVRVADHPMIAITSYASKSEHPRGCSLSLPASSSSEGHCVSLTAVFRPGRRAHQVTHDPLHQRLRSAQPKIDRRPPVASR